MELIDKARILADFAEIYRNQEDWQDFISYNDLGIPYAIGLAFGHILDMSSDGETLIQDTWSHLCEVLGIDSDEEYMFIDDLFAAGV